MYLIISLVAFSTFISASESLSVINRKHKALQGYTNTQIDASTKKTDESKLLMRSKSIEIYGKRIFKNIISKNALLVILAGKDVIKLFNSNLKFKVEVTNPDNSNNKIKDLTLSPCGTTLLISTEKNCNTFDVDTKQIAQFGLKHPARRVAFLDDNTFVGGTTAGISLYDLRSNQEIECSDQKQNTLCALDHLDETITVATGYTNGLVSHWDLRNTTEPVNEWNKNQSKRYQVNDLTCTQDHVSWVDEDSCLYIADISSSQLLLSHKIKSSFRHATNNCPCLSRINAHQVELGYENKLQRIDLSSLECSNATIEDDLLEFATHDQFYITTHYDDKLSTIHKWTLVTQEEIDLAEKKTITAKKNN